MPHEVTILPGGTVEHGPDGDRWTFRANVDGQTGLVRVDVVAGMSERGSAAEAKGLLENDSRYLEGVVLTPSASQRTVEVKDLYATLISTRNLEIGLFWERSNYFLVLNTGMAFGFFKFENKAYAIIFGALGLVASLLWLRTCLGSKFWQARWEQRLMDFERAELPGLDFFAASPERIGEDVKAGLSLKSHGRFERFIYGMALRKPSVSFSMILLSCSFVVGWLAFIALKSFGLLR